MENTAIIKVRVSHEKVSIIVVCHQEFEYMDRPNIWALHEKIASDGKKQPVHSQHLQKLADEEGQKQKQRSILYIFQVVWAIAQRSI